MAGISDIIEKFIKDLLEESDNVQIQRNELATFFQCAPSQINYVLSTRFTTDNGYYIESKKGGGGYIKIIKLDLDKHKYISDIIHHIIKDKISYPSSKKIVTNLVEMEIITNREGKLILAAIEDRGINIPVEDIRDRIRANILRSILITILGYF